MMKIIRMRNLAVLTLIFGFTLPLFSQPPDESFRIKLESTLFRFVNWRFSNISLYQLKSIGDMSKAVQSKQKNQGQQVVATDSLPDCVKKADELVVNQYRVGLRNKQSQSRIERELVTRGIPLPDKPERDCIFNYLKSLIAGDVLKPRSGYLITTKMPKGNFAPSTIIALIVSYSDEDQIERNIDRANPADIYTYDELKQFDLDPKEFSASNLYDLMMNAFLQNNVYNKTLEAQGIGTFITWTPKTFGVSRSLAKDESDIQGSDIQTYLRISDGQPNDIALKENEIIASPDLISWRKYQLNVIEYNPGEFDTVSIVTNNGLPKYGAELKYGIDDINYPSFWSERISLRALWENVKLGLILPTNGWSSLSKDAFSIDRKLTYGGFGVSGEADFPFKVIRKSGVFHLSGGYVFGDAKEASYKNRGLNAENFDLLYVPDGEGKSSDYFLHDYLIRANAQMHYTFGIGIDDDYLLRFGIGGTIYSAETWGYKLDENRENVIMYNKESEAIGGLSGRVEFMTKNVVTPYGGMLQYFDEAIMTQLWLQIPLVQNTLAFRLDVKGYWTAFRDKLHPWENEGVFIPMARVIVNF